MRAEPCQPCVRRTLLVDYLCSILIATIGFAWSCLAATTSMPLCIGTNMRVGTFHLLLRPSKSQPALPVSSINMITPGDELEYEPIQLPPAIRKKARIALVIVPAAGAAEKQLQVLPARPAGSKADWVIPVKPSVLGLVFGPQGLDVRKVSSLIKKDPELIPELATYAKQTATVNALVETLSQYDKSQPGTEDLNAVLTGFSAQYNVALPQLDPKAPADQQAALLLQGVMPSVSAYNPLASQRSLVVQQSAGLAGAVATLFYGTPVGLAAGGAQLFENMRLMMFPGTDFRAAFIQPAGAGGLELCSANKPPAPRTRIAYLWMLKVPEAAPPSARIAKTEDIPLAAHTSLSVTCATHQQLALLPRARDWRLVSTQASIQVPVKVTVGPSEDTLQLDLSHAKVPANTYQLAALWDWSPLKISGSIHLRPFSDLAEARLTPDSKDLLIQDGGPVEIKLTGANFEFVKSLAIVKDGEPETDAWPLSFTLPKGADGGDQLTMDAQVDTSLLTAGVYRLLLTQSDDKTATVPVTVHPPDPELKGLPLRANLGLKQQSILLQGTGLERIERITSQGAAWQLAPVASGQNRVTERQTIISLQPGAHVGDLLSVSMEVAGLQKVITIPDAVQVAGPLPKIVSVQESFPRNESVALNPGEIPASATASFAIHTQYLDSRPVVRLACASPGDARQALDLRPGDRTDTAQLDLDGEDLLFLSLQPGAVGRSGCVLTVSASDPDTGTSAPYRLGTVIRLPRIDKFSLSDEKAGSGLYAGTLTGQNLQMIEQTGWTGRNGFPVQGIPTPVPGAPQEQTLEIEMPWPPPAPDAPVYIWLLGEGQGRRTRARY